LAAAVLLAAPALRAEDKALSTEDQKISYAIGRQMGQNLKNQGVAVDQAAFALGMQEAAGGKADRFTAAENQAIFQSLNKKVTEHQEAAGAKNLADGQAFLKENAKKAGVKTTKSGLQYKVVKAGKGASPK